MGGKDVSFMAVQNVERGAMNGLGFEYVA